MRRRVAGVDHIGLGGDYAGIDITPVDLPDVSAYPKVFRQDRPSRHTVSLLNWVCHKHVK